MKLQDFNFQLPKSLIATFPLKERSASKLLVLDRKLSDRNFKDLHQFLKPKDVLVINDTSVLRARLFGKKDTGAKVEILIERVSDTYSATAQTKSNSNLKKGDKIFLSEEGPFAVLIKKRQLISELKFSKPVKEIIKLYGKVPLPPYIKREATKLDSDRYQTIYADFKKCNSVAAPTAGLHFDKNLLDSLENKGIKIAKLTLQVGMGTFKPIKEMLVEKHKMHKEQIEITKESVDIINEAKRRKRKIVCVGTTSLRCLESVCKENKGVLRPFRGETDLYIYPGFQFEIADVLITNFHLPYSSLLVLVSAFAGYERTMLAYDYAIKKGYRFYSYGDAMLIFPYRISS